MIFCKKKSFDSYSLILFQITVCLTPDFVLTNSKSEIVLNIKLWSQFPVLLF